jgi:hypothetical protein
MSYTEENKMKIMATYINNSKPIEGNVEWSKLITSINLIVYIKF